MTWLGGITNSIDMFQQTLGDSEGQGSLMFCHGTSLPWDSKELDMSE